jgi:hypothetical protein
VKKKTVGRRPACYTTAVRSKRSRHISIFVTERDKEPLKSVNVVAHDCRHDITVGGFLED